MAPGFDPYAVLGVSRDATVDQVAQARRRLSRQYHPDVNPAPDAAARFDEVQRASQVLSDPAARAAYHQDGGHPGPPAGPATATETPYLVAQPAAVDFGRLGPARRVAYATVTVTWAEARPGQITRYPRGEWWTTAESAVGTYSRVALYTLRAEARAGMPAGPRRSQFKVTLGDTSVTVPLTAEFSGLDQPPAPDTAAATPDTAAPTATESRWLTVVLTIMWVVLVIAVITRVILLYLGVM